ncbi:hypothetical protein FRB94_006304 [Tulasnella sp. JGI-2019a]|nr:hypothetical protein FRB94_006304 [Tulasnella sp. JGI-2019a]
MTKSSKTRQKKVTSSSSARHTATGKKDSNSNKKNGMEQVRKSRTVRAAAGMKARDEETRDKIDGDMTSLYASLQPTAAAAGSQTITPVPAPVVRGPDLEQSTEALAIIST